MTLWHFCTLLLLKIEELFYYIDLKLIMEELGRLQRIGCKKIVSSPGDRHSSDSSPG